MEINANTVAEAVKQINSARLKNKNKWLFLDVNVNGLFFHFKIYNTWVCRAQSDKFRNESSGMDISVKQFKEYLTKFLEY